jgi:hypothetical protein
MKSAKVSLVDCSPHLVALTWFLAEDTPGMEEDFLRTLSLIKGDDPRIYDNDVTLYVASQKEAPQAKVKSEKPVYLKDHERNRLLTKGDQAFVSDDEEDEVVAPVVPGSYKHEQARLKSEFQAAVGERMRCTLA